MTRTARHLRRRPRGLAAIAAVALAAAQLAAPAPAAAHQIGPNYDTVLRSVSPQTPGLDVRVVKGVGQIQIDNHSGETVTVYGYDREPYVLLRADGHVFVNYRSPANFLNADQYGNVKVPKSASAKAKPGWQLVSVDGTYGWHDHRIHWMSPVPPRSVIDVNKKTKIFDWAVPIKVGAQRGAIAGTLYWAGAPKAPPVASIAVFAISAVTVLVGGFIWYRRTSDYEDGDEDSGEESPADRKSPKPAAGEKEAW